MSEKDNCNWFSEPSARQCRFPHPFCLLCAEPLYYAVMFIEGGGMETIHTGLYDLHNGAFLNPIRAKTWGGKENAAHFKPVYI